jgi:uncharacterized protein (TIGR00255 family)
MIKSMTGYAAEQINVGDVQISAEIRSYNSRHLDVVLRLPGRSVELEEKAKQLISQKVARGRVEIKVQIKDQSEGAVAFEVDTRRAAAFRDAVVRLNETFGVPAAFSVDNFLQMGLLKMVEAERDDEALWPLLEQCLSKTLERHDQMRRDEGRHLAKDIAKRLDTIEQGLRRIEAGSTGLLETYCERLRERISALVHDTVELDASRVTQEAAFLADRSDVSEEILRTQSHLKQFHSIMEDNAAGGRKLNFLLQELNRELNTMSAKIGKSEIAHELVDLKAEVEKIREQVQNVE